MQLVIQLMASVNSRDRFIGQNAEFRLDPQWWNCVLESWNGVGILPNLAMDITELESDVSGSWGCAAIWGPHWLQRQWSKKVQSWHITLNLPVLLVCAVWGREWSGKLICCHCDNMVVVEVINSRMVEITPPKMSLFYSRAFSFSRGGRAPASEGEYLSKFLRHQHNLPFAHNISCTNTSESSQHQRAKNQTLVASSTAFT